MHADRTKIAVTVTVSTKETKIDANDDYQQIVTYESGMWYLTH